METEQIESGKFGLIFSGLFQSKIEDRLNKKEQIIYDNELNTYLDNLNKDMKKLEEGDIIFGSKWYHKDCQDRIITKQDLSTIFQDLQMKVLISMTKMIFLKIISEIFDFITYQCNMDVVVLYLQTFQQL